jgi:RNA polymerase sigma-70 factor (ECF subfamily)
MPQDELEYRVLGPIEVLRQGRPVAIGGRRQRALLAFSGDPDLADDSVAEAFVQALARWDDIRDPRLWVWKAAYRLATKDLRDRRRRGARLPESSYSMDEPLIDLIAALQRLTPMQRSSVVLHHYAGLSARETAQVLDSTPAAVFVHLAQGRKRLRKMMEVSHA